MIDIIRKKILTKYSYSIENRVSERNMFRFDYCGDIKKKVILDIGCGNGWFERYAYEKGVSKAVGIDIDSELINQAFLAVPQADFFIGSAEKLKFLDEQFDMIVMFDVLEHLSRNSETRLFLECERILKKDGVLIISTPNRNLFSCLFDPAWYFGHRHYSKKRLISLLKSAGFIIETISVKGGIFYLVSMVLDYLFKWVFFLENPLRDFLETKDGLRTKKEKFVFIIVKVVKSNGQ